MDFILVARILEQSAHDIINGVSSEEVADDRQEWKRVRRMLWHRRTLWPVGWSKMDGPTDIFSSGIEKLVRYSSIEPCDRCPETECAPLSRYGVELVTPLHTFSSSSVGHAIEADGFQSKQALLCHLHITR